MYYIFGNATMARLKQSENLDFQLATLIHFLAKVYVPNFASLNLILPNPFG